ncbi:uncharacterized protein LOC121938659 [Plectropomus leopardus]|uniref:uncharacterized protein LOC121938659 n=1 Tax=Plectropomus leopardus TaxID=160734 RepID=UPI001C4B36F0|nr:uncharacterized protein LOC121938659 [Plectropomus leopardus]
MFPLRSPVTVSVSVIAATVFATWAWKRHKIKKKMRTLDENIANVEDRLINSERSLVEVVEKTAESMDLWFTSMTGILVNQRERFRLDLEDVQTEEEDVREKLQLLERKISESEDRKEIDQTEEQLRRKQKLLSAQRRLQRRKDELEKLQLNTDKLLQSPEAAGRLTLLTDRKLTLKRDVKLLNQELEDEKGERDELQNSWLLLF